MREQIRAYLGRQGFQLHLHEVEHHAPVLVALRPPEHGDRRVGLYAHYDVEEAGAGWSGQPFTTHVANGRIYGRGVADNLGPLALRLASLEGALGQSHGATGGEAGDAAGREPSAPLPGLVWVIQGEEEIGSPGAHALFPRLDLPPVMLWLEETGYFEADGSQRILARRIPPRMAPLLDRVTALAHAHGRQTQVHDRYLNKAFGTSRCPFLTHLVGDTPYLAIGPNDTRARIHAPDESLPLDTLQLAATQLLRHASVSTGLPS
ncbi:MAG: M20/M25/M40 family metallo-hydrolase, partial [Myxococcota bacterium]